MGVFGAVIVISCASFLIGIVIGYNQGFKECTELFKKVEKNMWNSAIDDFAEALKKEYENSVSIQNMEKETVYFVINVIAEQLKGEKQI